MKKESKVLNSKGQPHYSCPHIDEIQILLAENLEHAKPEVVLEINERLENIRSINSILRDRLITIKNFQSSSYKISAVIKTLKIIFKNNPEVTQKIDETVSTYL